MGEAWGMVFDAFDTILPAAKKHDAVIALEPVFGMLAHDFYTAKFLIDHYQSPNIGLNFDPSHDILSGNYDTGWMIRQWGKETIKHVHLKDAAGIAENDRFIFPLLGEGKINWRSFKEAMREIGYQGVMSVEFESFAYLANILDGSMEEAAGISMDCVKKLFR
jgi:sugar phosphate isomerase/epimerase